MLHSAHEITSLVLQVGGRTGVEGPGLSKWQRGLWGLGTVFMQYAWTRMDQIAATQHWGDIDSTPAVQRAWAMLRSCETALNVASLLNFLVFLRQGKYRQACTQSILPDYGAIALGHCLKWSYTINRHGIFSDSDASHCWSTCSYMRLLAMILHVLAGQEPS